jgi:hypothetical protein
MRYSDDARRYITFDFRRGIVVFPHHNVEIQCVSVEGILREKQILSLNSAFVSINNGHLSRMMIYQI